LVSLEQMLRARGVNARVINAELLATPPVE